MEDIAQTYDVLSLQAEAFAKGLEKFKMAIKTRADEESTSVIDVQNNLSPLLNEESKQRMVDAAQIINDYSI